MRRVAIIQARFGSTRLPGKVLEDVVGLPMLARVIERTTRSSHVDEVVVATTTDRADDALLAVSERAGARWYRGSPSDVLARVAGAAREAQADVVVRITADCPLIDAGVVSRVVAALLETPCDYASNVLERSFPRGLDAEALHADTLYRADRLARSEAAREHVTWSIYREHPELWLRRSVVDDEDNSDLRWTVDTIDDLALIRALYSVIASGAVRDDYREIVRHVRANPQLTTVNAHVRQRNP